MTIRWLVILTLLVSVSGCDKPAVSDSVVLEGKTMGTVWRVSLAGVSAEQATALRARIQHQLDADDMLLSTWKADSLLSKFNRYRGNEPWPVTPGMADIVIQALRVGTLTGGAMDITVGPLVNLWGFGPDKLPVHTPDAAQIRAAKMQTGLQHLRVIQGGQGQWLQKDLPGLYVDLSTSGEGYAADNLARLMEKEGISRYLVSVGGAVTSRGTNAHNQPWRVAIQKPTDRENAVQARVILQGQGISTSGSYRNYYELDGRRISHVIDPVTGKPIAHRLVSATVIAPSALEADTWDTGLMVLGPEKAKALALQQQLAVYLVEQQGENFVSWMSPAFKSYLIDEQ